MTKRDRQTDKQTPHHIIYRSTRDLVSFFHEWGQSRTLYFSKGCLNSSDEEPNLKCIWRRQFDSLVLMNFQMSYSSGCSRLVVEKNFQENIPKYPPLHTYDFETDLSHGCKQAQPNLPALKTNSNSVKSIETFCTLWRRLPRCSKPDAWNAF